MALQMFAVSGDRRTLMHPTRADLPRLLADENAFVWICMDSETDEERDILENVLGIHPLLVDDAFAEAQSPKVEDHGTYLYLILHGIRICNENDVEIEPTDLDLFVGKNFLVTHFDHDFASVHRVRAAVEKDPSILAGGPAVVAHRLIDHMIDQYFPLMERLDGTLTKLEEEVLASEEHGFLERVFKVKRTLLRLRRIGLYQRDILHRLWRGDFPLIPESTKPFYRDVSDHFVRVTDEVESYRELLSATVEGYRSMQAHKMNEVMKMLTLFSTVVLPLNFVTGLYGMNFDFMPGLHWKYGYQTALTIMVTLAFSLVFYFRSRKWL